MNKVTIIVGPQGSGKTWKAIELSKNRNTVWLDPWKLCNRFAFENVDENTDVIVIEGVSRKTERLKALITADTIIVQKKLKEYVSNEKKKVASAV